MRLTARVMTLASADAIWRWRYPPPYNIYNLDSIPYHEAIEWFLEPTNDYHQIETEQGMLVGFCCFGLDAQVPGGDYQQPGLDLGLGVHPELTGRGLGRVFAGLTITTGIERYQPPVLRVTVASFNQRAIRVWQHLGLREQQHFFHGASLQFFTILQCPTPEL
jgi:RimJ/RimL family protein N-acetyltransferase